MIDVKQFKKDLKKIVRINNDACMVHLNCFQVGVQVTSRMAGVKLKFSEYWVHIFELTSSTYEQGTTFRVPYDAITGYTLHEVKGVERAMCVSLRGRHNMVIREWT